MPKGGVYRVQSTGRAKQVYWKQSALANVRLVTTSSLPVRNSAAAGDAIFFITMPEEQTRKPLGGKISGLEAATRTWDMFGDYTATQLY